MYNYTHAASLFSEAEEEALAADLLAVHDNRELEQFLGRLLKRAASTAGHTLRSRLGQALGALAKGAVHRVLPGAKGDLGPLLDAAATGRAGQLAAGAARLLGLESEGLSAEDQEFNAAQQLVRLTASAAARAAAAASTSEPARVAQSAMIAAARQHAPGLVRAGAVSRAGGCSCRPGERCSCRQPGSGSWERQGRRIILHGV